MKRPSRSPILMAVLITALSPLTASALLPPDQVIDIQIRETPGDPESPVVWEVSLFLHALDQIGDDIQWEVESIQIRKMGATPELDTVWVEAFPQVWTADGTWWVSHIDGASDFRQPPAISGLALNVDPAGPSLTYDLLGEVPGLSPEDGYLTYTFLLEGDPEPEEEDGDAPVDVPSGVRDPLKTAE